MKTLAHSILVWLLLLALPFQGVAAAGMLPCAPTGPVAAVPAAAAPMGMAGHDHAAMLAAQARSAQADNHCVLQATPDKPSDCHDANAHHGKGSCASCCMGAAMAPAALPAPLALASPAFISIPFRAGHVPSVDPVLPERPPRARSA